MDKLYCWQWLIRLIIRNFDGTKTHYPTQQFYDDIKECGLENSIFLKIIEWQINR